MEAAAGHRPRAALPRGALGRAAAPGPPSVQLALPPDAGDSCQRRRAYGRAARHARAHAHVLPPREHRRLPRAFALHARPGLHRADGDGRPHRGPRRRARDQQLQVLRRLPGERRVHRALRVAGDRHPRGASAPGREGRHRRARMDRGGGRPQASPALRHAGQGARAGLLRRVPGRHQHPRARAHAPGLGRARSLPVPAGERPRTACAGASRGQERRAHEVPAREPRRQHVVSLAVARQLRLPRARAPAQDQVRQGAWA